MIDEIRMRLMRTEGFSNLPAFKQQQLIDAAQTEKSERECAWQDYCAKTRARVERVTKWLLQNQKQVSPETLTQAFEATEETE